jgi:hypothetical protein
MNNFLRRLTPEPHLDVETVMNRASVDSLDGYCRFVARLQTGFVVLTFSDFAVGPKAHICAAFVAGRRMEFEPRPQPLL